MIQTVLTGPDFKVIQVPEVAPAVLAEFEHLPFDPYTGGKQRYRRFSQFRMAWQSAEGWLLHLLPHRPFIQPPSVNSLVGGQQRHFEPLRIDPTPQIAAGAEALDLDRQQDWQLNVHQCRVIADTKIRGVSVPEGRTATVMPSGWWRCSAGTTSPVAKPSSCPPVAENPSLRSA